MNNEEDETAKIIADVWERYLNMSEEEKAKWEERHLQRVRDIEQAELEEEKERERLSREGASKDGSEH
jgi:23S rRNA G2069 N7-methylase RlmK/C1962 C5-methylase RlmI